MNKFDKMPFIHGADYNPEQWIKTPKIIDEDMKLMKKAGINAVSIGIFAWSEIEPRENKYNFDFFDFLMDKLNKNNIKAIFATPSGARPRWLAKKYPEVLRTNEKFEKMHFGERHNHCPSSPIYRERVKKINGEIAKRYKDHEALILWHVSNEYGGECHCEICRKAFISWLKNKYNNDLDELNFRWWNKFWNHSYDDWDEIEPPSPLGETSVNALNLEWKRFVTYQTIDFFKNEIAPLKEITPNIPVTTNFHNASLSDINYQKFSKYVDVVSFDAYPLWHKEKDNDYESALFSFVYSMQRSFKNKPFLLMESTPSQISYTEINKLKRPQMAITSAIQAVSLGADSVQYFQWRKSRGGWEKFHGAVIDHYGKDDTRIFNEVKGISKILNEISEIKGTTVKSEVAIVYDWESRWALDDAAGFKFHGKSEYLKTCVNFYKYFSQKGINADIISPNDDFDKYKLVVIPMLYLVSKETILKIKDYVKSGNTVVSGYITGYVDETDLCYLGGFPADELKEVFGIWNEEIDVIYENERIKIKSDFENIYAKDFCEILHLKGAKEIAKYDDDFYKGMTAATKNKFENGLAYYIGFRDENNKFINQLLNKITEELKITSIVDFQIPDGISISSRFNEENGKEYIFVKNFTDKKIMIENINDYTCLIGCLNETTLSLEPFESAIIVKTNPHA